MTTRSYIFIEDCRLKIALIPLDDKEASQANLERAKAEAVDQFIELLDIKLFLNDVEKQKTVSMYRCNENNQIETVILNCSNDFNDTSSPTYTFAYEDKTDRDILVKIRFGESTKAIIDRLADYGLFMSEKMAAESRISLLKHQISVLERHMGI